MLIDVVRLLLVCTANQCRSPMAEGLLRHRLAAAGVDADVRSAGVFRGGVPATPHAVDVLGDRGIDLAAHVSRTLAAADVVAADLVIGMERRHVQEAVVLVPEAEAWSFTLRDFVARAEAAEPRRPHESVHEWAARLAASRPRDALLGTGDDGIADPIGRSRAAYERTATELDDLIERVVRRLLPEPVSEPVPNGRDPAADSSGVGR